MIKIGRVGLVVLVAIIAGLGTSVAQEFETNCVQPITTVESCSVTPEACWIETDAAFEPWLVTPTKLSKNPKTYRAFCSEANATPGTDGHWYSYAIYLPPGYDLPENEHVKYPVVYWFSGRLSELDGYDGRGTNVAQLVDKRIFQRKIRPVIYVFPYGGVDTSTGPWDWIDQWTDGDPDDVTPGCKPDAPEICFRADSAFDELMAHVEANYRVLTGPKARTIQGFSRGGGYALQRVFRRVDGDFLFGAVAGMSAAANWEGSRFEPNAEDLAVLYANDYPNADHRPIQIMLKHGDLLEDGSGLATANYSDYLEGVMLDSPWIDPGVDPIAHSIEEVVPACGEEEGYPPPCGPGDQPPVLGHQQGRMLELRGNEVIAFHQASFERLSDDQKADLDSHRLPCALDLPFETEEPNREGFNESYFVGDWDGDGCDSVAIRHDGRVLIDNGWDDRAEDEIEWGPDGVQYFGIDWLDEGEDDFGYARYDTQGCSSSWEIRLYTKDRHSDGHDEKDEPFFCFDAAPRNTSFLIGDFDGDWRDDIGFFDDNEFHWTPFLKSGYTGLVTGTTSFGGGDAEDQYTTGRWVPVQETYGLATRRDDQLLLNTGLDGEADIFFQIGGGDSEDQYLFGDWDGDGVTNVGLRRCNLLLLDVDYDPALEFQYYFGWGTDDCE